MLGSAAQIMQKRLLERYALRVDPMMADYVARRLSSRGTIAVMGADARTGIPTRVLIDPAKLSEPEPAITAPPHVSTPPAPSLFS